MIRTLGRVALVTSSFLFFLGLVSARELTFEDRVRAQEEIERVYYAHRAGETIRFAEAVPRSLLESKVSTYLKQSVALERIWRTPVTADMLRREVERMAASSRMPDRLQELYAALGNDSFLVAECLARPALVDRMSRTFYEGDESIHAAERAEVEGMREALLRKGSALAADSRRRETEVVRGVPAAGRNTLESAEFAKVRGSLPARVGEVSEVADRSTAFEVRQLVDETPGSVRFATFTVPKKTWEAWWGSASRDLDPSSVRALAPAIDRLPLPSRSSSCLPDDTWANETVNARPQPRTFHTAIWTGSEMIVWGGKFPGYGEYTVGTGGRYDPATDTWSGVSTVGSPSGRWNHSAVWTGTEMIVWGGLGGTTPLVLRGARYEPASNTWKPITEVGAPEHRNGHTAIWTGTRMIVWAGWHGTRLDTGARYDPETDTWTPMSSLGAPQAREGHTAIWTGSRMVVWGGVDEGPLDSGGQYDPASDTWSAVAGLGAPSARGDHTAVWTGAEMIVWGGADSTVFKNDGGRYDPATDHWTPMTLGGAPIPRSQHTAVWTGSKMFVWGSPTRLGGLYDPASDSWTSLPVAGTPRKEPGVRAVWTGNVVLVWGGDEYYGGFGSRYDPVANHWTKMSPGTSPKSKQSGVGAVWTGTHVILWGGDSYFFDVANEGTRWDPATGTWTATSLTNAPAPRRDASVFWTGREMLVWNGWDNNYHIPRSGGFYDPVADTWRRVARAGAVYSGSKDGAVWTGTRMIVAGSSRSGTYDPVTDRWDAIASPAASGSLVWTGSRVLLLSSGSSGGHATSYDPLTDVWTPFANPYKVKSTDGPLVWTGKEMIVWGNGLAVGYEVGYRYAPDTDTWTPTSTALAPAPRQAHTAIWTGERMVVWGGADENGFVRVLDGGRYDPATDSWTSVALSNAPSPRSNHVAVWTGSEMVVWGATMEADGGVYSISNGTCASEP